MLSKCHLPLAAPYVSMVSCQKGPTRHAYAWQIGSFWQDTLGLMIDELNDYCVALAVHNM